MNPEFWHSRWRENQIGFHQSETNKLLMKYWPDICPDAGVQVFVPLCGKSLDMLWLADRGHGVLGVELSEVAVHSFFEENRTVPETGQVDGFTVKSVGRVALWCGDFFNLEPAHLAGIGAVYDRASLIALPPEMRRSYASQMARIVPPGVPTLLLTVTYDESEIDGPPFSVGDDEVRELYGEHGEVTHLDTRDALKSSPGLQERGLKALTTSAYRIVASPDRRS